MNIDVYVELPAIAMAVLGVVVSFYPPPKKSCKRAYLISFVFLAFAHLFLVYRESIETEIARKTAQEQQQVMQQKLDRSLSQQQLLLEENRGLKDQNRDLDAQLTAIRKKFGVPAEFEKGVSLGARTGLSVDATVEKGPSHTADDGPEP